MIEFLCRGIFISWGCHGKAPQTGGFKQQKCVVLCSGYLKSEIKVSAGLVLSGCCEGDPVASFPLDSGDLLAVSGIPSLQVPPPEFCLHPHMAFSLCKCFSVQISPFCKDAVILDRGPS